MKNNNYIFKILFLIISTVASLSLITLASRFLVALYFFIAYGGFYFSNTNFIYSIKAGVAAGIPLGLGFWILEKINKQKSNKDK